MTLAEAREFRGLVARLNYLAATDTAKNVQSMSIAQMENTVMMAENVKQCAAMK